MENPLRNADWDSIRVFVTVADSSSFRQAAERLGMSINTARRVIQRFEDQLGYPVLHRDAFGLQQLQMNLDRIQAIDSSFGLAFGTIRVWDGASSMQVGLVLKSTVAPFVKTVQDAMDKYKRLMVHELAATATNAHGTASQTGSIQNAMVMELERLAKLKAEGHLSEEEFKAAKAKLLSH